MDFGALLTPRDSFATYGFVPQGIYFPLFPVIKMLYHSHELPLSREARYNKEVTGFELFDLSCLVIVLLADIAHTAIGRSRRRELHL